jgi:hypothetical protein
MMCYTGHHKGLNKMITSDRTPEVVKRRFLCKPSDYEVICMVARNLPYQFEEEHFKGRPMTGGVLGKGRIVWVQRSLEVKSRFASALSVSAYAEGIGIVSVDARCLVRAS